jgi:hypothetical protein
LSTNNKMRFLRSMMRRQVRFLACDNLLLLQAQTWTPRVSNKRTFKNLESRDKRKGQRVPAGRCGTRLWSCELEFFSTTRASLLVHAIINQRREWSGRTSNSSRREAEEEYNYHSISIIVILINDASRIGLSIKEESDQEEQAAAEEKQKKNISTI